MANKNVRVKVGDIFKIPLSGEKSAYGQYVHFDSQYGGLLQVFDIFTDKDKQPDIEKIADSKPLFPAVFTGLKAAVKLDLWEIIGNKPVTNFIYPGFISTLYEATGEAGIWFFWDGEKTLKLGKELPDKYKSKEFLAVYAPDLIVKRIETRKNFYESLIKTNRLEIPK